jgi:hypothetical protein
MGTLHEQERMSQAVDEHYESMAHSMEGDSECGNCGHDRTFHLTYMGNPAPCDAEIHDLRGRAVRLCECKKFRPEVQS